MKKSLEDLNLDYLDLFLVHWPAPIFDFSSNPPKSLTPSLEQIWPEFEACVDQKLVKHIGLCNANVQTVTNLLANC